MAIDPERLQVWFHENCGQCKHAGDKCWIDVQCVLASHIVWDGPPYSKGMEDYLQRHIEAGSCPKRVVRRKLDQLTKSEDGVAAPSSPVALT